MTRMKPRASVGKATVWLILGPAFLLLALVLPVPKGMTPEAMKLVGVTALMAVWWLAEVVNLAVVAMIPLVAFPLLGIQKAQPTAQSYADQNIFLFMGGLLLASAMQRWGLHRRMAVHVLYLLGSRPKGLVLGFMVATAFLSMWISNTATAVMMVPIGLAMILQIEEEFDAEKTHSFSVGLMLGIAYACSIGGFLGVLLIVPLRRYFCRDEHGNLPFPEATATTEILLAGERGGSQAKVLGYSMLIGIVYDFLIMTLKIWPEDFSTTMIRSRGWHLSRVKLTWDLIEGGIL